MSERVVSEVDRLHAQVKRLERHLAEARHAADEQTRAAHAARASAETAWKIATWGRTRARPDAE